ncbi:uncharacterized protein LOC134827107 [Culicoides brevitarsis]|uniref:uncharacterized protein LOC134827107 n=1 Tax=Culicoides brevitarsis TaxID=469753 RepID=UPI00307C1E52
MEVKNDRIEALTPNFWPKLRELFTRDWPENQIGYFIVDDYIKWLKSDFYMKNVKLLTLNGDFSDGTFVVVDRYQLFIYTLEETNERLTKLLRLLDWKKGFIVSAFRKKFLPAVLEVIKEKKLEIEYDSENFVHFLPKEKATEFHLDIPEGFEIRPLSTLEHAKTANDLWAYKHDGSLFYLKRLIDLNPTMGVFIGDELIAWCFRFQSGVLGALQVKESFRKKGFGKLVTKALCKELGKNGSDVMALVADSNEASKRTFQALGFEIIDCCHWIKTIAKEPFDWNDLENLPNF